VSRRRVSSGGPWEVSAGYARAIAVGDEAGFTLDEVVRTRMYLVDPADIAAVTAVHGEVFSRVRPAATLVVVARLMTPSLLVEVEAEARRG
jgi:enamine deaminase RidA (YjgF/YER057c/UK114 family)